MSQLSSASLNVHRLVEILTQIVSSCSGIGLIQSIFTSDIAFNFTIVESLFVKEERGIHSTITVGIGVCSLCSVAPREVRTICHLICIQQVNRGIGATSSTKANREISFFEIIRHRIATQEDVFGILELVMEQLHIIVRKRINV